ncbi:ChbG/HpnK family deacetylase [Allorhizobium sp. BGMRC 0089]|uniref:ChbG/HpnK family deacetylase n=1 Tax=Allorhizobium sonneratiae TaxID=2934936 RepID=UPI0020345921|nr:ChbG/HpnK family deacetylase [Allorhizobium sonneratiae]MCM2292253.1 ChbG/HpnK family deacetylase [Allorhizobium sonneratiae]
MKTTGARPCIVADGYGLSPGVDQAIRTLIAEGKICGTSCMTVFDDWRDEAELLLPVAQDHGTALGLHLTLTNFKPLSGVKPMCSMRRRMVQSLLGGIDKGKLQRELDAQLNAFIDVVGRTPDYIDGYQHVHYFPVVREWLIARRDLLISPRGHAPWLRGEPDANLANTLSQRLCITAIKRMAVGFNRQMAEAGYQVRGPLTGFYMRRNPQGFAATLKHIMRNAPKNAVIMCKPGHADAVLQSRDRQMKAREVEFAELMRQ